MRAPEVVRLGDAYIYRWPEPEPVEVEVDEVRRRSDDWVAYITVRYRAPGVQPHLFEGNHNLAALQSRTALPKYLATRVPGVDWAGYLEMACVLTMRAERRGDEFREAGSLPPDEVRAFWLVEPLLRDGLPTVVYGEGGAGKSTLAAAAAAAVLSGERVAGFRPVRQAPVLYLDWETDIYEVDDTLKALRAGHGLDFPDVYYRREVWPLVQTVKQVRRFVEEKEVGLVIVDSIGAACGGEPETAEVALRFFTAVRSIGAACLLIHHENRREGYYGSPYIWNSARMVYRLRKQTLHEPGTMHLGLYQEKANKGERQAPRGLCVRFGEGGIRVECEEIPTEELVTASAKVLRVLRGGTLTREEIAEATGLSEHAVRARLSDLARRGKVVRLHPQPGQRPATSRYGLAAEGYGP